LGDIDVKLDIASKDEIGKLADNFKIMTDSIKEKRKLLKKYLKDILILMLLSDRTRIFYPGV